MALPEIIGLVGPVRAGKSTVAMYLSERFGYQLASNSDVLKDVLARMNIEPSRANLQAIGDALFETMGDDIIARYRVAGRDGVRIVIDGVRYLDEWKYYSTVPGSLLIAVDAEESLRYARVASASDSKKDGEITQRAFSEIGLARSERQVPVLMRLADKKIDNTSTIESLQFEVDRALGL